MGRRNKNKYGTTAADVVSHRELCPKCKAEPRRTFIAGSSHGSYQGCHDCKHEWGWADARGSSVSRAKYEERAEANRAKAQVRSAKSWCMDAPAGEESDMAKKKKVAKKSKGAKGAKAKPKPAAKKAVGENASTTTPEDRAQRNAMGYACSLIVTSKLDDTAICKAVLKKFPEAAAMYRNGTAPARIRLDMKNHKKRYAWTKGLKRS